MLLDALPDLTIADKAHILQESQPGVFKFSDETRLSMPQLEWFQLYNLVKVA